MVKTSTVGDHSPIFRKALGNSFRLPTASTFKYPDI